MSPVYVPINPDMVIVRSRDLKHVLLKLDAVVTLRDSGRAWKNTEKVANQDLRRLIHSAPALDDLIKALIEGSAGGSEE